MTVSLEEICMHSRLLMLESLQNRKMLTSADDSASLVLLAEWWSGLDNDKRLEICWVVKENAKNSLASTAVKLIHEQNFDCGVGFRRRLVRMGNGKIKLQYRDDACDWTYDDSIEASPIGIQEVFALYESAINYYSLGNGRKLKD